ncbi:MAG: hypothetical protein U5S82_09100 [Gammaproteobacteria bacterium]|nr:hypothetical protein [Gammaproteobacteria bacterium]
MISSLPSRFNRGPKRALYVAGHQLTAYEWRRGGLTEAFMFQLGEEGLSEFSSYLNEAPSIPVYMVVDVVEEEYRRDTVPHVSARDRRGMVEGRIARYFRDTSYHTARFQGRETVGRKDDRVLYSALTNPGLLTPWVDRIIQAKVPLAGIYSLPLLCETLVPYVAGEDGQSLIMTLQGSGNLRQCFFSGKYLKMSRLAHVPSKEPAAVADAMLDEAEKLRRYLNSLRLLPRDRPLNVYMLTQGRIAEILHARAQDTDTMHCVLVEMSRIADGMGMNPAFVSPYADALFAHLLLRRPPANHYATPRERRYNTLRYARNGMTAATIVLGLGAVAWTGMNVVTGMILSQRSAASQLQTAYYQQRYDAARTGLPELPAEAEELKRAVEAVATLEQHRTTPLEAMELISLALDAFPRLRVEQVAWGQGPGQPPAEEVTDKRQRRYQKKDQRPGDEHAVLDGRIDPFDGDYRAALDMLEAFAANLRGLQGVVEVRLTKLPLNLSPNQALSGNAVGDRARDEAGFSLIVVLGEQDGQA